MKPDWMTDDDYPMPYVPECVLPCEAILDDPDRLAELSGPCVTVVAAREVDDDGKTEESVTDA